MNDYVNGAMNCTQARMHFALLVYGELSFDEEERVETHLDACADCRTELERQKSLHAAFDGLAVDPPASLLRECRSDLAAALRRDATARPGHPNGTRAGWWDHLIDLLDGVHILRPMGAFALILVGFLGARLLPVLSLTGTTVPGMNQASIARVSDVEPQTDGSVRIVLDETRQKTITGSLDDQTIRTLLLEAVRDPNNPGLRADSVDLLTRRAQQSAEIRRVLVYLVVHDQNDGVRLKAMGGLKEFSAEPEVRKALSRALLSDANPGVRTQAIDLLIQGSVGGGSAGGGSAAEPAGGSLPNLDSALIGTLQQLMLRESNASVRQRCEKVLEAMNASAEIY
jgi:hypothetical protein